MIEISAAIMHHPRRAERIPPLVRACAPLVPRVVADPEPDGAPSPLRTAKRAWAAIGEDATHHLVLQDDVRPVPGFAAQLRAAVERRPGCGVSLFSMWHSPQNSYLVRRAAVAGAAYAPLSPYEWTPTQGIVLPAEHARALAEHLAGIPDEVRDEDEMVVIFCRERNIPVVATVPHLLDHGHAESLVEGHHDGLRATVFGPDLRWSAERPGADADLPPGTCTVALHDSVCSVRLVHGDPVEHQFGWYWYDACPVVGVDPERVLDAAERHLSGRSRRALPVLTEVWAACYLLGMDVARTAPSPAAPGPLTAAAVGSWLDQGLTPRDHRDLRAECLRLAITAVESGVQDWRSVGVL